ncbi:MAG TPA: DUF3467 domain-containing protein [Planctomycetaceae bacterium]|nr:DUF3467 domain-containing protein [Planctomycetaceae bacterium]
MAKDTETQAAGEQSSKGESAGGAPQAAAQPGQQAQQAQITIDDNAAQALYANFCRVSSTPEELVLDLGLNPQPYATGPQTIRVSQRVILNHFTAKRLLSALSMALQRHEQAFGVLETDIRKRVRNT